MLSHKHFISERRKDMMQYLETTAGKLYADCGVENKYVKYVEIGFCDDEGNHIPIAALEVKTKALSKDIDETIITRVLYNPSDDADIQFDIIK